VLTLRTWSIVATCLLLMTSSVRAEGWLTGWIPGAKKESSTSAKSSTTRTPLLGGKSLRSTSKTAAKQPSMWQRMTSGTRRLAANTKEALTFGGDEKPKGRHSSWDDATPARSSRKQKDEPSFLSRWFQPDEPRPSKTVDDFLSQKRPEQVQ
jgi:hypothetical protein